MFPAVWSGPSPPPLSLTHPAPSTHWSYLWLTRDMSNSWSAIPSKKTKAPWCPEKKKRRRNEETEVMWWTACGRCWSRVLLDYMEDSNSCNNQSAITSVTVSFSLLLYAFIVLHFREKYFTSCFTTFNRQHQLQVTLKVKYFTQKIM